MRRFVAALLMCAMLAALSACGGSGGTTAPDPQPSTNPLAAVQLEFSAAQVSFASAWEGICSLVSEAQSEFNAAQTDFIGAWESVCGLVPEARAVLDSVTEKELTDPSLLGKLKGLLADAQPAVDRDGPPELTNGGLKDVRRQVQELREQTEQLWTLYYDIKDLLDQIDTSREEQAQAKRMEELAAQAVSSVKLIFQNPELPNGCETVSLAMLLDSAGQPIDKVELYRDYLPKEDFRTDGGVRYGPDPEQYYIGNAASQTGGWYCFEGPIIQAANGWLDARGSDLRARAVTGLSQEELDGYARSAVPVAVWVTLGYAQPQYSSYTWLLEDGTEYYPYRNLHCVVLAGTEGNSYRIADPINGFQTVNRDTFWASFSAMGSRAVIIE